MSNLTDGNLFANVSDIEIASPAVVNSLQISGVSVGYGSTIGWVGGDSLLTVDSGASVQKLRLDRREAVGERPPSRWRTSPET